MKTQKINQALLTSVLVMLMLCFNSYFTSAQNWTQITSGTTKKLNSISFPSATVGYIAGDSLLLKTTDGGATWNAVNFSGINFFPGGANLLNIQFLNDTVGFVTVGPYSGTYGTSDGGITWTALNLPSNLCYNIGMFFLNQSTGYVGGAGCFQGELISNLSGGNWLNGNWNLSNLNSPSSTPANIIVDIDFYDAYLGMAVSKSGFVYRTTDSGANWDSVSTPAPLNELTSILVVNDTLAYAGYTTANSGFGLYVSTDAGMSWSFDMNSATFLYPNFYTLHQTSNGTIYTAGDSPNMQTGVIFNNQGSFSSIWNYDMVAHKINDVASYNDSIVFAVGDSGFIVVNHPSLITNSQTIQHTINLVQVYPNPAKNTLYLNTNNTSTTPINFTIFNSLGVQVIRGTTSFDIDIHDLNAGIYFIEIQIADQCLKHKFIVE